ncbi:hypothetical protein SAMN04488003_11753 [Loktanella fryxellensis]|uniref:Peptidase propeptide and YPEB domain-containing protein n=1 Tax=Loktanella fryxellensis TaxID=245187 RepID=A0A1H8GR06_9RHOB|nr:hypothetical protein [Loktanella fryxellensis]SEN46406.1 hypothetical protein SAMN04488003_11753 [Loktanella fryxellensis]
MRHAALTLALVLAAQPLAAQQDAARPGVPAAQAAPLELAQIAEAIAARYRGRLLAIRLDAPRPPEAALGARLVYEADYLTVFDNRLTIRLDASTGMFLLVDGAGQTRARILP